MYTRNITKKKASGFSLVELLIVIAVIGIMGAIALPSINNINDTTSETAARSTASNIASVFNSGIAAGAPGFRTANSVDDAMNAVGTGSGGAGALSVTRFELPGVTSTMDDSKPAAQRAKSYLAWVSGALVVVDPSSGPVPATPEEQGWEFVETYNPSSQPHAHYGSLGAFVGYLDYYINLYTGRQYEVQAFGNKVYKRKISRIQA
jgi:type IV pilus assembly protein PilA